MWFFDQKRIASAKNGEIVVNSFLGTSDIFVGGFHQSSGYIQRMWRKALRHVPRKMPIQRVLMLGLGGGSAVALLRRRFPGCAVTVVEWDPEMIALYRELHRKDDETTICEGDAFVVIPGLQETFDLVIVDLFKGNETPGQLGSPEFIKEIRRVLAPNGHCLLNAFVSLGLISAFGEHFSLQETWKFQFNTLALYRELC